MSPSGCFSVLSCSYTPSLVANNLSLTVSDSPMNQFRDQGDKLTVKRLKLYEPKRKPGICCGSGGGRSRNRQQALTAVIPQQQPSFGRDREERLSGGQVGEELGGEAVKKAAESTEAGQKPAGGWCCLPFGRRRGQLPPR